MSKLHIKTILIVLVIVFFNDPVLADKELNGLGISISDYTANPSEDFCVDVSVSDFIQIVSTQYSIQWDPSVIQFVNIIDINIPHPENMLFNASQSFSGILTALWFDSEGEGNDLPDGTVIFRLCFTAVGAAGSQTTIAFENEPVNIEITDIPSGGANIGLMNQNGNVSIASDLLILGSELEIPDCGAPQGGSIDLTASGGQMPLSYEWMGPAGFSANTEDISGLGTGYYFVTITDASIPPLILTDSFFIDGDFVVPLAEAQVPDEYTCKDTILTLDGGNSSSGPGFQYLWVTAEGNVLFGGNTLNPTVNAPGVYQLIVTDTSNGCTSTAFAEVLTDTLPPLALAGPGGHINCDDIIVILDGTASSMDPGDSAFWTTAGGSILTGENTYMATVNGAGTYTITIMDGANGCTASAETTVTIDTISPLADAGPDLIQPCFDVILDLDGNGSSTGAEYVYQWTTGNGHVVSGQNTLTPQIDQPGIYELLVENEINGCTAGASAEVSLDPSLVTANGGDDEQICEDSYLLMADLPAQNTGQWTVVDQGLIESPGENASFVNDLEIGSNLFVWTLSTDECINYSSDTIELFVEGRPVSNNDEFSFPFGIGAVDLDLVANDDFGSSTDWQISILEEPSTGDVTEQGNGVFEFDVPAGFSGAVDFSYETCNAFCPDLCDTAVVRVLIEAEILVDTLVDIPNSFTPNEDGVNDTFIIPDLENNPLLYPENELVVFNRWGDVVYRARPYFNDWKGQNETGKNLPGGTYYYVLKLDISSGRIIQGDVTILK